MRVQARIVQQRHTYFPESSHIFAFWHGHYKHCQFVGYQPLITAAFVAAAPIR